MPLSLQLARSVPVFHCRPPYRRQQPTSGETDMKWETPAYSDIRFGFEVTMYINNK